MVNFDLDSLDALLEEFGYSRDSRGGKVPRDGKVPGRGHLVYTYTKNVYDDHAFQFFMAVYGEYSGVYYGVNSTDIGILDNKYRKDSGSVELFDTEKVRELLKQVEVETEGINFDNLEPKTPRRKFIGFGL